jgi:hypothetical protein
MRPLIASINPVHRLFFLPGFLMVFFFFSSILLAESAQDVVSLQVADDSGKLYTIKVQGYQSNGQLCADVGSIAQALHFGSVFDGGRMQIDHVPDFSVARCTLWEGSHFAVFSPVAGDSGVRVVQLISKPTVIQGRVYLPVVQACRIFSLWLGREVRFDSPANGAETPHSEKGQENPVQEWMNLAAQGNADAQNNLGLIYSIGRGVKQDYAEALKWYRFAAVQGHAGAQNNLGLLYSEGASQNFIEALKWFQLAADKGNPDAQDNLGLMYFEGKGIGKDYAEAVKWFRLSAQQGNADARNNLGWMYHEGYAVPKDYGEALRWFLLSAAQGVVQAQFTIGEMYEKGQGVNRDIAQAAAWYKQACDNGLEAGCARIRKLRDAGY